MKHRGCHRMRRLPTMLSFVPEVPVRKLLLPVLAVLALSLLSACTKKQGPLPPKQARVSATKAYEKYFGPAPTTDKGTCYAFVIYFPSVKQPGKVVPFPFFTFDERSLKKE